MSEAYYTDLRLTNRGFDQQTSDRNAVDISIPFRTDLQTVEGRENLAQAIINRLLTRQGELSKLGHPTYGSRLYLIGGQPNNLRTQAKADFYIRECLAQESRIAEITFIEFATPDRLDTRSTLQISIGIQPTGGASFSLNVPINL
ncbi:MAG: DUF2634 domain-containing protein [Bacteroidota bacterium]